MKLAICQIVFSVIVIAAFFGDYLLSKLIWPLYEAGLHGFWVSIFGAMPRLFILISGVALLACGIAQYLKARKVSS